MGPVALDAGPWRPDDVDVVRAVFQDPGVRLWNGGGVKHDELLWARPADDPAPQISIRS
jgi:hypothetical protein